MPAVWWFRDFSPQFYVWKITKLTKSSTSIIVSKRAWETLFLYKLSINGCCRSQNITFVPMKGKIYILASNYQITLSFQWNIASTYLLTSKFTQTVNSSIEFFSTAIKLIFLTGSYTLWFFTCWSSWQIKYKHIGLDLNL